jgi:hypothetical protein
MREAQAGERMRGDDFDALGDFQARRVRIDDEGGDAARPGRLPGAGKDHVEIRDAAVRNPGLLAVELIAVAVRMRRTAHGTDIGPGIGFGQGKGGDGSPGSHPRQVVPLLLFRPVQRDGTAAQALHGEGEIGQAGMPRQGFTDQADAARVNGFGTAAPGLATHSIADPVRPHPACAPGQHRRASVSCPRACAASWIFSRAQRSSSSARALDGEASRKGQSR